MNDLKIKIFVGIFCKGTEECAGNYVIDSYYSDHNCRLRSGRTSLEEIINRWIEINNQIEIIERVQKIENEKITVIFWYKILNREAE